jgi:hypothetical protein
MSGDRKQPLLWSAVHKSCPRYLTSPGPDETQPRLAGTYSSSGLFWPEGYGRVHLPHWRRACDEERVKRPNHDVVLFGVLIGSRS